MAGITRSTWFDVGARVPHPVPSCENLLPRCDGVATASRCLPASQHRLKDSFVQRMHKREVDVLGSGSFGYVIAHAKDAWDGGETLPSGGVLKCFTTHGAEEDVANEAIHEIATCSHLHAMRFQHMPSMMGVRIAPDVNDTVAVHMSKCDMTLGDLVRHQRLTAAQNSILSRKLLAAMVDLWERCGVAHLDLKPSNIMVTGAGEDFDASRASVQLVDWNAASLRSSLRTFPAPVHKTTLWYEAPENVAGAPLYSAIHDVWSCATVIAFLWLRRSLFKGKTFRDVFAKQCVFAGTPSRLQDPYCWTSGSVDMVLGEYQWPSDVRSCRGRSPACDWRMLWDTIHAEDPWLAHLVLHRMLRTNPNERASPAEIARAMSVPPPAHLPCAMWRRAPSLPKLGTASRAKCLTRMWTRMWPDHKSMVPINRLLFAALLADVFVSRRAESRARRPTSPKPPSGPSQFASTEVLMACIAISSKWLLLSRSRHIQQLCRGLQQGSVDAVNRIIRSIIRTVPDLFAVEAVVHQTLEACRRLPAAQHRAFTSLVCTSFIHHPQAWINNHKRKSVLREIPGVVDAMCAGERGPALPWWLRPAFADTDQRLVWFDHPVLNKEERVVIFKLFNIGQQHFAARSYHQQKRKKSH